MTNYLKNLKLDSIFYPLLNNLTEGVFVVDQDGKVLLWNKAAEEITGYSSEEMINKDTMEARLEHYDDQNIKLEKTKYPLNKCLATGEEIQLKLKIAHKNSFKVPVSLKVIPVVNEEKFILGAIQIFSDESLQEDLENANKILKEISVKDHLTNLYDRQEILERISIEVEKASRYEMPVCLCLCDIDGFKSINSKYGQHTGDIVLKRVSEILRQNMRKTDILGRYEGGKFILLLPLIDIRRARHAIEKLKNVLASLDISVISPDKLYINYGLTEIIQGDTLKEFTERAEHAAKQSKKEGKNKIIVH